MREFKGRIIAPGTVKAEAVVSRVGFNTLASFQGALQFGDKKATCGDQNNADLHGKQMAGKALCLPQTIGSTTGALGDEFLNYVKDGMTITIGEDGTVTVE